jgi:NAD(P)H-dependent FMN reductase
MTRIAIVAGSTRPNRRADRVADWVLESAQSRGDADYVVVDLKEVGLPLLDEPEPAAIGSYRQAHTQRWSELVASFDGFVFVTAEYNHGPPAALKNAIDYLYAEWHDKAVGFVGYGMNGGLRAVEHLRQICAEVKLADVRTAVALQIADDFADGQIVGDRHAPVLHRMLDEVLAWAHALSTLRSTPKPLVADQYHRPALSDDPRSVGVTRVIAGKFAAELQSGIDSGNAEEYNAHFAADVLWGSPFGATVVGYDALHPIHQQLLDDGAAGPASRYRTVQVSAPAADVVVAQVRRDAPDNDGFSEMALYVLVRRNGQWWLAAGQNTPIRAGAGAGAGD